MVLSSLLWIPKIHGRKGARKILEKSSLTSGAINWMFLGGGIFPRPERCVWDMKTKAILCAWRRLNCGRSVWLDGLCILSGLERNMLARRYCVARLAAWLRAFCWERSLVLPHGVLLSGGSAQCLNNQQSSACRPYGHGSWIDDAVEVSKFLQSNCAFFCIEITARKPKNMFSLKSWYIIYCVWCTKHITGKHHLLEYLLWFHDGN